MNYYIQHIIRGPVVQCSKTEYYKVKRAVLNSSKSTICLCEYKGNNYKQIVIL